MSLQYKRYLSADSPTPYVSCFVASRSLHLARCSTMADQLPPPPSPSPGSTTAATTTGTTATPSSTEETAPDSASTELDKIKRELRRLQGDFKHACVFRKDVGTSVQSDSSASAKRLFEILQQYHSHMAIMKEHAYPAIVSLGGNVNRNVYSLELAHCYRQVLEFAFENLGPAITRRQLATIPTFLKTLEKREAESTRERQHRQASSTGCNHSILVFVCSFVAVIEEEQQQANDSIIGAIDDEDDEDEERDLDGIPRRLRLAETVLRARTSRILLVLERCYDDLNQQAVLRTAECLGIQHVWTVRSFTTKCRKPARKITRGNHQWLSLRSFESTADCITALHEAHYEIWATDLSPTSECLGDDSELALPPKVAIIIGREADGVSQEMLAAASRRIFLPIYGTSVTLPPPRDPFSLSLTYQAPWLIASARGCRLQRVVESKRRCGVGAAEAVLHVSRGSRRHA